MLMSARPFCQNQMKGTGVDFFNELRQEENMPRRPRINLAGHPRHALGYTSRLKANCLKD
jgi:hypothetical protein